MDQSPGLTIQQFADAYGLKVRAVQQMIKSGRLGCQVISPRIRRIHQHHIDTWLSATDKPAKLTDNKNSGGDYHEVDTSWQKSTKDRIVRIGTPSSKTAAARRLGILLESG